MSLGTFAPENDKDLIWFPKDIAKELRDAVPQSSLCSAIDRQILSPDYNAISDLRRVVFHRGVMPRQVIMGDEHSQSMLDSMPSNPAMPEDKWAYNRSIAPDMLDAQMAWCDASVAETIVALDTFTTGW